MPAPNRRGNAVSRRRRPSPGAGQVTEATPRPVPLSAVTRDHNPAAGRSVTVMRMLSSNKPDPEVLAVSATLVAEKVTAAVGVGGGVIGGFDAGGLDAGGFAAGGFAAGGEAPELSPPPQAAIERMTASSRPVLTTPRIIDLPGSWWIVFG